MPAPNSPAVDITTHLQSSGIGTIASGSGWSLHTSVEPPTPSTCVTVYDAGGYEPDAAWLLDMVIVTVRVRGDQFGYVAAFSKAQAIKDLLLGSAPLTVGTTVYIGIWMNGDIIHLGNDENDRPLISMNFRIARQPATATNRDSF